jgi:hypothetical protein
MARWIDQDLPEIKNETKKMKKATGADEWAEPRWKKKNRQTKRS